MELVFGRFATPLEIYTPPPRVAENQLHIDTRFSGVFQTAAFWHHFETGERSCIV